MYKPTASQKNTLSKALTALAFLMTLISFSNFSQAQDSVEATVSKATTLRELDVDGKTLILIDELERTNFQLPKGTKLAFTPGNLRKSSPFESDENPGELVPMSRGKWQKSIRIDSLPGYTTKERKALNKKSIFISEGVIDKNLTVAGGQRLSWNSGRGSAEGRRHRCYPIITKKVEHDKKLSSATKKSFPKVFSKTLGYYEKYKRSVQKKYITFIDYSINSNNKRFFLVNLNNCTYSSEFVAHGGSGRGNAVATTTRLKQCAKGNRRSTRKYRTRHGIFRTAGWHESGKNWPRLSRHYKGIKTKSLNGFNKEVYSNAIVLHEAPKYVKNRAQSQGRSQGCPAFAKGRLKSKARKIVNKTLLYVHAPQCGRYR